MVLTLKHGAGKAELKLLEKSLNKRMRQRKQKNTFKAKRYNGILNLEEDPLEMQKRLRDEWERDFS